MTNLLLILLVIPILLGVGAVQYSNWRKYRHEGNGANLQRLSLMSVTAASFVASIGCLFGSFFVVTVCLFVVGVSRVILYWTPIKELITKFIRK